MMRDARSTTLRYGAAVLFVSLALGLRGLLTPIIQGESPFVVLCLGVVVSAWYGGFGPGVLATVLAAAGADLFFLPPLYSFFGNDLGGDLRIGLFVLEGGLISWLSGTLRAALHRSELTEQKLAEVAERKNQFLAMLAHELRNPLAPLTHSLETLKRRPPSDPDARQACSIMERQVESMVRLVDDLMDVSRIASGRITLFRERLDLNEVVARAVETSRPLIDSRGHRLDVSMPGHAVWVAGDPVRLAQVVVNLLNNAAKYTSERGHIALRVEKHVSDARIRIRDNGIGIPRELLPRIFDLFTQIDRSAEGSQGGLGLGLALVRNLVSRHGGSVRVRSAGPGRGSEFTVRLPLLPRSEWPAGTAEAPPEPEAHRVPPPRRILIVDDHADAARGLGMLLAMEGYSVRTASDGPSALEAVRQLAADVVLLDLGLPGMDGFEVARRVREEHGNDRPLLIALTGFGGEEDRRRSAEAGFDHHLVKPVSLVRLQELLAAGPLASREPTVSTI